MKFDIIIDKFPTNKSRGPLTYERRMPLLNIEMLNCFYQLNVSRRRSARSKEKLIDNSNPEHRWRAARSIAIHYRNAHAAPSVQDGDVCF